MANKKVRVAIIGVGNCASSLVQGVQFYKDTADDAHVPGIMHARLGGYHIRDIEFTLPLDVLHAAIQRIDELAQMGDEHLRVLRLHAHSTLRRQEPVQCRMISVTTSLKHVASQQDQRCAACSAVFIPAEDSGSRVLSLKVPDRELFSALMCGGCHSKWSHGTMLTLRPQRA